MRVLIDDECEWQQRQYKLVSVELAMTNTAANNAPSQLSNQFANFTTTKYHYNVICFSSFSRQ
jgi:hypothetical protein